MLPKAVIVILRCPKQMIFPCGHIIAVKHGLILNFKT